MLQQPITIDNDFIQAASKGRSPEKRFRFANNCVMHSCTQWTGERCGIIDEILPHGKLLAKDMLVQDCAIRAYCRWYGQVGIDACRVCPLVITDVGESP